MHQEKKKIRNGFEINPFFDFEFGPGNYNDRWRKKQEKKEEKQKFKGKIFSSVYESIIL